MGDALGGSDKSAGSSAGSAAEPRSERFSFAHVVRGVKSQQGGSGGPAKPFPMGSATGPRLDWSAETSAPKISTGAELVEIRLVRMCWLSTGDLFLEVPVRELPNEDVGVAKASPAPSKSAANTAARVRKYCADRLSEILSRESRAVLQMLGNRLYREYLPGDLTGGGTATVAAPPPTRCIPCGAPEISTVCGHGTPDDTHPGGGRLCLPSPPGKKRGRQKDHDSGDPNSSA